MVARLVALPPSPLQDFQISQARYLVSGLRSSSWINGIPAFRWFEAATKLARAFKPYLGGKRVVCLNIPDNYKFMDPALVKLLRAKVSGFLSPA